MKVLTNISQIDRTQWLDLINRSPVTSIFQAPELYDFYKNLRNVDQQVVAISEDSTLTGLIVSVIQKEGRGIKGKLTSRAIINGGPLLDNNITDIALKKLLNTTRDMLSTHCIYIESRNLNDYSRWRKVFEECGFHYNPHYNFHIDTTNPIEVDKRMDKSRRRRIRRAKENNVIISTNETDITDFYVILSELYHKKIHKPLPPKELFQRLIQMPFAKYFIIKNENGVIIGGQLILMLEKKIAYAWYCCGLDQEYHDLYPSIMANYAAIRHATDNGFYRYDMMGGGSPDDGGYGVRDFKAQFGGTLVEHGRYLHVCRPAIYWIGNKAISLLKYLQK